MAFTIPDNDEAFHIDQARWMQTDINALVQGAAGEGVLTGCGVTAQVSPDMTVAAASGTVQIARALVTVGAGNVTITAANGTYPRIDLVTVNNSGTKSATAGTAAASPKAPDIPANSVLLAMVYVPASIATITSNKIIDKRVVVQPDYEGTWTPVYSGSTGSIGATAYAAQSGLFSRKGNKYTIHGQVRLSNNGDWTGTVKISGLPATPSSYFQGNGLTEFITLDGTALIPTTVTGATYLQLYTQKSGADGVIQACSGVPDNGGFWFTVTFFV